MNGKKCWYLTPDDRLSLSPEGNKFLLYGYLNKFRYFYQDGRLVYEPTGNEWTIKKVKEEDWIKDILTTDTFTCINGGNLPLELLITEDTAYAAIKDGIVTAIVPASKKPFTFHWPAITWRKLIHEELLKHGEPVLGHVRDGIFKNAKPFIPNTI